MLLLLLLAVLHIADQPILMANGCLQPACLNQITWPDRGTRDSRDILMPSCRPGPR